MDYTDEQKQAIDLAGQGRTMKVSALAGTGKTSTLVGIAQVMRGRGLYLAFNKGIATEAQQRFQGTRCQARTFHSLAYATHGKKYGDRLGMRINGLVVRKEFSLWDDEGDSVAAEALDTVHRFLRTPDEEMSDRHYRWMDDLEKEHPDRRERYCRIRERAMPVAHKLYALMSSASGRFPSSHDVYLQQFVRSNPNLALDHDYLLFDEAQDADRLMLHLCQQQQIPVFWVGDQYQQIYGWRGAQNAMSQIQCAETFLTQSFRFGDAIADAANRVLETLGTVTRLKGLPGKESSCRIGESGSARAFIARTNTAVIDVVLPALEKGRRVGVAGRKGLLQMLDDFRSLCDGKPKGQFTHFATEQELRAHGEEAMDIKAFLRIVDSVGLEKLDRAVRRCEDLDVDKDVWKRCDLIALTGHKAKGLEFDSVRLADDFFQPKRLRSVDDETGVETIRKEELRLIYVAMTRARHELFLPDVDPKADIFGWFHRDRRAMEVAVEVADGEIGATDIAGGPTTTSKKRRAAQWESQHPEKVRQQTAARVKRYRERHPEKVKERMKAYRQEHKAESRAYMREYRKDNEDLKAKHREYMRAWRARQKASA